MLALTRKTNESIMIGNDVEITILEIKGEQVKIGISAPKSISIYRKEIYLQIEEANKQSAQSSVSEELLKDLFTKK
jgi:carbon storage regulator